jgi:hypothetical protein
LLTVLGSGTETQFDGPELVESIDREVQVAPEVLMVPVTFWPRTSIAQRTKQKHSKSLFIRLLT